jgi:hypothetical protein
VKLGLATTVAHVPSVPSSQVSTAGCSASVITVTFLLRLGVGVGEIIRVISVLGVGAGHLQHDSDSGVGEVVATGAATRSATG